jgi:hypothetical protein
MPHLSTNGISIAVWKCDVSKLKVSRKFEEGFLENIEVNPDILGKQRMSYI